MNKIILFSMLTFVCIGHNVFGATKQGFCLGNFLIYNKQENSQTERQNVDKVSQTKNDSLFHFKRDDLSINTSQDNTQPRKQKESPYRLSSEIIQKNKEECEKEYKPLYEKVEELYGISSLDKSDEERKKILDAIEDKEFKKQVLKKSAIKISSYCCDCERNQLPILERIERYKKCIKICNNIINDNPYFNEWDQWGTPAITLNASKNKLKRDEETMNEYRAKYGPDYVPMHFVFGI